MTATTARGGYTVVADVLNAVYEWPDGREVSRQAVENWFLDQTRNKAGTTRPEPVDYDEDAPRTQPRFIFDAADWVEWVRAGVRGERRRGWVVPVPRAEGAQ
jgi:hypothetical protein